MIEVNILEYSTGHWRAENAGSVETDESYCFNLEGSSICDLLTTILIYLLRYNTLIYYSIYLVT